MSLLSLLLLTNYTLANNDLCAPNEFKVNSHHRSAYVRADGTFVSASNVKTHCKTRSKAYDYTFSKFKEGVPNNWPHRSEKVGTWTESQKMRVIEALEDVPEYLYSSKIFGLYRLKKSKDYPNPASSADGIIVLYDSAFSSKGNLSHIIAHELAHQNYLDIGSKGRQDYRRATGWRYEYDKEFKYYDTGRKSGYTKEDGKVSSEEDYANNLEFFVYQPEKLKNITPGAYDWFVKKFGDELKKGKK
jgi:hypothetical protein